MDEQGQQPERWAIIAMNVVFNIAFYCLILLVAYHIAPLHEFFHYLPCKLAGLSPEMTYFKVTCNGIAEMSHAVQFFYFMGPYLFYSAVLVFLYRLSRRTSPLKYLIPLPLFDILFNYMISKSGSDFRFLLQNTYPNKVPFILSVVLVIFIVLISIRAYIKYRIYSFTEVIKKFFSSLEKIIYKN